MRTTKMSLLLGLSGLLLSSVQCAIPPPPLDLLSSIWQPAVPSVYGALSVTNAWGSLLLSSQNVLAINAIEMAPFSSGWDSTNLYGWPTDTATLSINGARVAPQSTLWTPYSGIRNGSDAGTGATVSSEVRWVFESQAVLFEVNITHPTGGTLNASIDFLLPLRYYPRADLCDSWHYPTHSEPCCFNWFPSEPAPGQESYFAPTWEGTCGSTLSQLDAISPAGSAFAIAGGCSGTGSSSSSSSAIPNSAPVPPTTVTCPITHPSTLNPGHLSQFRSSSALLHVTDLGKPTSTSGSTASWVAVLAPGETVRLRFSLAFSNASAAATNVGVAEALAAQFPAAWVGAAEDWQGRFNAVFDRTRTHFSGFLPTLSNGGGEENWVGGFETSMERVYYASIVGLLANERTNFPPIFPGVTTNATCPVSLEVSGPFNRSAAATAAFLPPPASSGADKYLSPTLAASFTGSSYSGGGRGGGGGSSLRGGFGQGKGKSHLLRSTRVGGGAGGSQGGGLTASHLLDESDAPWRMFITGGGMNTSTNIFTWDNQYGAQLLLLLEPETYARQILLWMGSVDEAGVPSYLSFWGYDYASRRGVGNYYSTNLFTLLELITAYCSTTGDYAFLNTTLSIPYPNGTLTTPTLYQLSVAMAQHWQGMNPKGHLGDFGLAPNLLECVPSYIHYVAGPNAGNAWMSHVMAGVAQAWGDGALAQELHTQATAIANDVVDTLYAPGGVGYWVALQPNGSTPTVRHAMDFSYVTRYLGVVGGKSGGGVAPGVITPSMASQMVSFFTSQLQAPHWMRALSLSDPAAPLSNRSDHGPSGAYIGWPALSIKALHALGRTDAALEFLNSTLFGATLGPYGQAIELNFPGDPYKPMDVTLYNAMVSCAFADAIMQVAFGWVLPPVLPGQTPPPTPLERPGESRGFNGVMSGVEWNGGLWDVVSNSSGLFVVTAQ